MKLILIAGAALLASTSLANAEAFTFTSKGATTNQVAAPGPGGTPTGASFATTESETTWASGKKSAAKGNCATWSAAPGGALSVNGACTLTDADGGYAASFACAPMNKENTIAHCWGGLTGTSGKHKGKSGTVSWRTTQAADGKSNTAAGSGQWY